MDCTGAGVSGEILFLAHRTPFPPDRGDKIRSHNVLNTLARLAPVHVGCLAENEADLTHVSQLEKVAASYWMPNRSRPLPIAGISALVRGLPISLSAFADQTLKRWVSLTLAERPISAIYVFSGQMGQYVPLDWNGRLVMDFVDVDSAKFESYAAAQRGPMSIVHAREGRLLRQVESDLASRAEVSLLVSDDEADLMRQRCAGQPEIQALGNGIDCDLFDPNTVEPHAELAASNGPHFVFTGQMDYAPNVAAVKRFARKILPAIRAQHDDAQFHIVGRAPTAEVQKLSVEPGVRVWGAVLDMKPFLAAADLVVAPLTIARGVQNKVLEAMAMSKTVLASPQALNGIKGNAGEHFVACGSNDDFVNHALQLLEWPGDNLLIGQAARKLVAETMSWPAMLAKLPQIMGFDTEIEHQPVLQLTPQQAHKDAA